MFELGTVGDVVVDEMDEELWDADVFLLCDRIRMVCLQMQISSAPSYRIYSSWFAPNFDIWEHLLMLYDVTVRNLLHLKKPQL
jgi:hypothetical protein